MKLRKKDWVMIAIIVVAVAFFAYAIVKQRENLQVDAPKKMMYGEYISKKPDGVPVLETKSLPDGTKVYLADDGGYTKMVSEKGENRYYVGAISGFDPAKWTTYEVIPAGMYNVRDVAAPAPPPPPPTPSPVSAPGPAMSAGNYSASCSKCAVVDNQISCACDVIPVAK